MKEHCGFHQMIHGLATTTHNHHTQPPQQQQEQRRVASTGGRNNHYTQGASEIPTFMSKMTYG
jgi:hypothetical protein